MSDYPVIDFRTRPPVPEFSDSFPLDPTRVAWMCSRIDSQVPESYKEQSLDRWREEMHAVNVVKAVVIGNCLPPQIVPNDFLVELGERVPEVVGFAAIDPIGIAHDPVDETVRCIKRSSAWPASTSSRACRSEKAEPTERASTWTTSR